MFQDQPEEEPEPKQPALLELPVVLQQKVATFLPARDWGPLNGTCQLWGNRLSIELSVKAWQHQFPDLADLFHIPFQ